MRVIVTGAGGFIGSHLVKDQLERGHTVTAVDLHLEKVQSLAFHPGLRLLQGDFTDHHLVDPYLEGQDVCFHLASAHLETRAVEEHFWKVNVQGAREFVERACEAGVPRFVHCSSVGVYGDIQNPPADEESECHPDIPYEKSKLAGEQSILEFAKENRYPVVVIRPSWVYGPGCPRTVKLFRSISKGRFFYVGSVKTLRHPIYIEDMVAGFELAAAHPDAPGEIFIMAGPQACTLQELVDAIATCVGVNPPRLRIPKSLGWVGAGLLEFGYGMTGKDAPFTRRSLKFFTGNTAFDTRKAREVLGYYPEVELGTGLQKTYEWLQAELR